MLPFHQLTDFDLCHKFPGYSDEQVEQLLAELLNVLEKHKAPTDLSLMVLGNMVTLTLSIPALPRPNAGNCQLFARALQSSINEDKAH